MPFVFPETVEPPIFQSFSFDPVFRGFHTPDWCVWNLWSISDLAAWVVRRCSPSCILHFSLRNLKTQRHSRPSLLIAMLIMNSSVTDGFFVGGSCMGHLRLTSAVGPMKQR